MQHLEASPQELDELRQQMQGEEALHRRISGLMEEARSAEAKHEATQKRFETLQHQWTEKNASTQDVKMRNAALVKERDALISRLLVAEAQNLPMKEIKQNYEEQLMIAESARRDCAALHLKLLAAEAGREELQQELRRLSQAADASTELAKDTSFTKTNSTSTAVPLSPGRTPNSPSPRSMRSTQQFMVPARNLSTRTEPPDEKSFLQNGQGSCRAPTTAGHRSPQRAKVHVVRQNGIASTAVKHFQSQSDARTPRGIAVPALPMVRGLVAQPTLFQMPRTTTRVASPGSHVHLRASSPVAIPSAIVLRSSSPNNVCRSHLPQSRGGSLKVQSLVSFARVAAAAPLSSTSCKEPPTCGSTSSTNSKLVHRI